MFGLSRKFYLKTITFMDTISALGLLSTKKECLNNTKRLYSILVSTLATLATVIFFGPFLTKRYNKLLNTYFAFSGFIGLLFTGILIFRISFQSVNKKKALLGVELVHLRIKKHSVSVSQSAVLDLCKELLFIMQYLHEVFYFVLHFISLYYVVTASELKKDQFLYQLALLLEFSSHLSVHYSFTMMNLLSLESFFQFEEEILATAHPKNSTLSINKVMPPVDQAGSSVFTIRPQSRGWFTDIRSKQIRTLIKDYFILEDITNFTNNWHSSPLTWMLTLESMYIPTLPISRKLQEDVWPISHGISKYLLIIMLLMTVVSSIATNMYYRYTKYKLGSSLGKYIYRSNDVKVQQQLMNLKLFLSSDFSANHWKWFNIDFSLLSTIFDTSVLILTTFLAELVQ